MTFYLSKNWRIKNIYSAIKFFNLTPYRESFPLHPMLYLFFLLPSWLCPPSFPKKRSLTRCQFAKSSRVSKNIRERMMILLKLRSSIKVIDPSFIIFRDSQSLTFWIKPVTLRFFIVIDNLRWQWHTSHSFIVYIKTRYFSLIHAGS